MSRTSGAFLMVRGRDQEKYLFSDCAINVNPTAQELAEIAVDSAKTAELFEIDPKVAMLSFSTKGSAKAPEVDKVVEATKSPKIGTRIPNRWRIAIRCCVYLSSCAIESS